MVKIEVRVSHRTDIYKTSGEKGKGWSFISKEKNGKWPGEYSNEDAEWYVIIEENLPCIKGLTDELEQEFSDRVNKEINEIEKGKKYVPITYELEFDENAGKTNTPDREGWTKKRIFWDDGNIKIKKVSKDNDRERERERESKIEELRKRIEALEAIANRTPQQEQELQNKKRELAELEKQQSQDPKKTNWTPWIIGGGIILVLAIVIVYLLTKNSGEKNS